MLLNTNKRNTNEQRKLHWEQIGADGRMKDYPPFPMPGRLEGKWIRMIWGDLPEKPEKPRRWARINSTSMVIGWAGADSRGGGDLQEHVLEMLVEELTDDEIHFLENNRYKLPNLFLPLYDPESGMKYVDINWHEWKGWDL